MTTKIRHSVFETNSSSTHSLSLSKETGEELMDMSLTPAKDETGLRLTGGEFGWEWSKYNDAVTKANYVALLLQTVKSQLLHHKQTKPENNNRGGFGAWADKHYGECYRNVVEVLEEQTGCGYVDLDKVEGYIDHQSCEDIKDVEWLLSKKNIRTFIFNKKSWLFTGNDNDEAPVNFYDDPDTVYTHKLVIDIPVALEPYKFEKAPNNEELSEAISTMLSSVSYNKTTDRWKSDYDFNSRGEKFSFPHRKGEFNIKTKEIVFIKEGLWDVLREQAKKNGSKANESKTFEDNEKFVKELEKLPENRHIIKYSLVKI